MELDKKLRMLSRSINVVYYTIYLLTIIAVVVIFFMTYGEVEVEKIAPNSKLGINISTVYMIFLLVSIPASLFLFHQHTLKLRKEPDEMLKFSKYKKASYIRLWVIGSGLIIGIILVYLLRSQSMIFMSAIAAIALYFCKPSALKITRELELENDDDVVTGKKYL
ncbi:MAG: hypothetical protein ACK5KP_01200 [Paludibacteraceae bacterium]